MGGMMMEEGAPSSAHSTELKLVRGKLSSASISASDLMQSPPLFR